MIFEGIAQEKMHFLLHGIKWLDEFFSSAVSLEIFNHEEIHLHMISSKYQCYMQTSDRLKFDMQLGSWSGGGGGGGREIGTTLATENFCYLVFVGGNELLKQSLKSMKHEKYIH